MKFKDTCLLIAAVAIAGLVLSQDSAGSPGQYAKTVEAWNKPVDPFRIMGNIYYVGVDSKRARLRQGAAPNPFIGPAGYSAFIKKTEDAYMRQLEEERKAVVSGRWSVVGGRGRWPVGF